MSIRVDADLIIMSPRENSPFFSLHGNTTLHVMDQANCPVLSIKENVPFKPFRKICYVLEKGKEDLLTLKNLIPLARIFKSEIQIIHINTNAGNNKSTDFTKTERQNEKHLLDTIKVSLDYDNISLMCYFEDDLLENILKELLDTTKTHIDVVALLKYEKKQFRNSMHKNIVKSVLNKTDTPVLILHKD